MYSFIKDIVFHPFIEDFLHEIPNILFAFIVTGFFSISKETTWSWYYKVKVFSIFSTLYFFHSIVIIFRGPFHNPDGVKNAEDIKHEITNNFLVIFAIFTVIIVLVFFVLCIDCKRKLSEAEGNLMEYFCFFCTIGILCLILGNGISDDQFIKYNKLGKYRSAINLFTAFFAFLITVYFALKKPAAQQEVHAANQADNNSPPHPQVQKAKNPSDKILGQQKISARKDVSQASTPSVGCRNRAGNFQKRLSRIFLSSLFIVAVGHYFSIINISALLESLPGWFIFALGICTTIFVQKKLLNQPTISESTVAIRDLELLRNDPTRLTKLKKYTGEKNVPFTADEFRRWMKLVTEFTIDYYEHPEVYDVITSEKPGFVYKKLPAEAPFEPESFDNVLRDLYKIIMPGLTHWQHPRFHAYFHSGQSYPDIVAETLTSAIATVNFCWDSSPAFTELEIVMVNWLGKVFGLPCEFLFNGDSESSRGGGSIQNGGSDSISLAFLAARHKRLAEVCGNIDIHCRDKEHSALSKLVAYASTEAHSSVEKAALISLVHMRPVKADEKFKMRGKDLEKQVQKDVGLGNVPFLVVVTLGTTSTGAYDELKEIVLVAKKYNLWVHIDGSYGGTAWCCEEFRYQMEGINDVDSININLHKTFLHSAAVSFFWTRNQRSVKEAMTVDPAYLHARHHGSATDFRNWGIPLSRRAKCLKTWVVLRTYGIRGMKEYIRRLTKLTTRFRGHLEKDSRIEIVGQQVFSLVCFKLKLNNNDECNRMTKSLCEYINHSQKLCVTYAECNGISICRFSIGHQLSLEKETDESYEILSGLIDEFLQKSQEDHYSREILFKAGGGVVGSPALTTQSTLRSTASYASLISPCNQSPSRSVGNFHH